MKMASLTARGQASFCYVINIHYCHLIANLQSPCSRLVVAFQSYRLSLSKKRESWLSLCQLRSGRLQGECKETESWLQGVCKIPVMNADYKVHLAVWPVNTYKLSVSRATMLHVGSAVKWEQKDRTATARKQGVLERLLEPCKKKRGPRNLEDGSKKRKVWK